MNSRKGPAELARLARSKFEAQPADLLDIDALCLALGVVVRKASLQGLHGSLIKRDGQLTADANDSHWLTRSGICCFMNRTVVPYSHVPTFLKMMQNACSSETATSLPLSSSCQEMRSVLRYVELAQP